VRLCPVFGAIEKKDHPASSQFQVQVGVNGQSDIWLTSGYQGNGENRQGKKTAEIHPFFQYNRHRIDNQRVIS